MDSDEARSRPLVGIGVLIVRGGRVLLGKRRNAHGAGDWAPPGGHLEFGETPQEAAAREVREEVGLTITSVRLIGVTNDVFTAGNKHYVTLFLVAECASGEPALLEPNKCEGWGWYDFADLPQPLFAPLKSLLEQGVDLTSLSSTPNLLTSM